MSGSDLNLCDKTRKLRYDFLEARIIDICNHFKRELLDLAPRRNFIQLHDGNCSSLHAFVVI
jgi:hypothetical protein